MINQLFKIILIANFTLEESTIDKRRENPDQYRLENTIQTKQIFHTLQRNFQSSKEKKEIKLEVGLSSGDTENLLFIFKNKEEFIELLKYCNPHYAPKFPRFDQLTEADIKSVEAMTIHLIEERESDHRFHPNEEGYTTLQHFIAEYIKYYHLLNYLIYLGNKFESKKWSVLKNTFALIGESRNYNNISSKYALLELEESERNRIILQIHEENTRYSNAPEPAIFLFVKHRISYLFNKFSNEYLDKKSTKPPFDRLIEDPFFKSIRELLQSTVNLLRCCLWI